MSRPKTKTAHDGYGLQTRDHLQAALDDPRIAPIDQLRYRHEVLAAPSVPRSASMRADQRQTELIRRAYAGIPGSMSGLVRDEAGYLHLRVTVIQPLQGVFGGKDHFKLPTYTIDQAEAARRLTVLGHIAESILSTAVVDLIDISHAGTDPRYRRH